ncbi:lamin tail domain-containing protein, partial [Myxococcota bacterium]|nr:lamin tail domain-containing protein [Myxococcota bacterium]
MKKLLFLMIVGSVFFVGVGCDPGSGSREEICDNGIDDDGDWFVDCADIACVGRPGDSEGHLCQITEQNCHDGFDNDGDGMTDMEDPDCFAAGEICDNDMDDDGDGDVDCDDSDCVSSVVCQTTEICDNGTDDDGDGDVDCDDPDCLDSEACVAVENCTNETDDDGDGDVDCDDADCTLDPACVLGEDCANGIDDDSDTYTDCADPECDGETGPGGGLCEAVEASCADGYDNDGDGEADCNDADCASSAECQTVEICDNGTDDDSDGLIDCLDPQCAGQQGPLGGICEVMESSCFDGYDNDGDGDMDCDDSDCALACMVAGDLVITEFIKDPNDLADSIGEWFELYNPTARDIDLRGLVIFSEGGSGEVTHVIASGAPVLLQAGEYMVLGPQGSILANPAVPVSYEYAGISLSNTSDNLGIRTGDGTLVDEIMYDEANYHTFSGM